MLAEPLPLETPEPSESLTPEEAREQIELLQQHVEELTEQLQLARQELAGVNPLLLSFGQGTTRYVANGRSIRGMSLLQKSTQYGSKSNPYTTFESLWAVMVDEVRVTDYLPEEEAIYAHAEAEARWSQALSSSQGK